MKNKQKTYGRLTIISELFRRKGNGTHSYVKVRCICGVEKEARLDLLVVGKIKSCGCLANEIKKELKERYGRLTVISEPYRRSDLAGRAMYVDVLCDCGVQKSVKEISLKSNITKSCGCLIAETTAKIHTTHGLSKHPLFKIWAGILGRCYTVKNESYPNYGGRGVIVCEQWENNFKSFYDWAIANGWKKGMEVDKDIKGGMIYSPENCLVVTSKENGRYKRTHKLNMQAAEHIRLLYSAENYTCKRLGKLYNVSLSQIYSVINNKSWA